MQKIPRAGRPRAVLVTIGLIAAWYGFLMARVNAYASISDSSPADAAIVMGAAVWGSRPSPVFAERINHGIDLYRQGRVQALIFTGGVGRWDRLAEGEVAAAYALARGVPAEHVFYETVSTVTQENVEQAARIVEQQGFARVLMVSDPIHMKRSVTLARAAGLDAHPSPTPTTRYQNTPPSVSPHTCLVLRSCLFDRTEHLCQYTCGAVPLWMDSLTRHLKESRSDAQPCPSH
jgi:uncharacterized SAM-binding protein YcdF (DUF218 family)